MMEDIKLIKNYCELETKFKTLELDSEYLGVTPKNKFLGVRLDGIGLSKKYLKDTVLNKDFKSSMISAMKGTYDVLHRKAPENAQNIFLAVIVASDEVTFILNNYDNYYEGRLFKIVTTIASTFSSFFSSNCNHKISGSFDGRPIVLDDIDSVYDYIACRSAIYVRNTISKSLRLKGVDDELLYSEENYNNLDFYMKCAENYRIDFKTIIKNSIVFIPSNKDDRTLKDFKSSSFNKFVVNYTKGIANYNSWLSEVNGITRQLR